MLDFLEICSGNKRKLYEMTQVDKGTEFVTNFTKLHFLDPKTGLRGLAGFEMSTVISNCIFTHLSVACKDSSQG